MQQPQVYQAAPQTVYFAGNSTQPNAGTTSGAQIMIGAGAPKPAGTPQVASSQVFYAGSQPATAGQPSQPQPQVYFAQPGGTATAVAQPAYTAAAPATFQPMPSNAPQVYTIGSSVQQQQYPQSQTVPQQQPQVFSSTAVAAQRPGQVFAQPASQAQQFYPQAGQQTQQQQATFYPVGGAAPAQPARKVVYAGTQQQTMTPAPSQQAPTSPATMGSVQVIKMAQPQTQHQQVQYAAQPAAYANQAQPTAAYAQTAAAYQNQQRYQQQQPQYQQPQYQQPQYQQPQYQQPQYQQPISVGGQAVQQQQATQVVYAQPRPAQQQQQQPTALGNAVIVRAQPQAQQYIQQQQQQQQQSTYYVQPAGSTQAQVNLQARPPPPPHAQQNQRVDGVIYKQPKVRELQPRGRQSIDMGVTEGPPQFVSHPVAQMAVGEGDGCTIKAVIQPAGDPTLEVIWLKDGVVLDASSRQYASFDRGYAVFQILYTNVSDSGEYCCLAKTSQGQAQSSGCLITVVPEDNVVTESQLPEESMVDNLAAMESRLNLNGGEPRRMEDKTFPAPTIVRPLLPQLNLKENERAKFETFVQPANDPSLNVEWFKDGKPLTSGCRFSTTMDRGFAILDIHYCYPEDSGDYCCVVTNSAGSVQSNVVQLSCRPGVRVVTDSVLSEDSISYLRNLDSMDNSTMASYDTRYQETEEVPSAPTFEVSPQETTAIEGSPVRLLVKAGGVPPPRVQWFINGDVLPTSGGGGAWRIYADGGISYLELNRCGPPGEFQVTVVAKNKMGEASASCNLYVEPQPDYRPDLKHVEPENPFKKMMSLKKVERSQELTKALSKPKARALDLRKLERRDSQTSFEAAEAESLYSRVQASLRTSRINSEAPPMQNASAAQMMREGAPTPQPRPSAQPRPPQPQPVMQQQQQAPPPPKPKPQPPPPQPQPQQVMPQQQMVVQAPPPPQPQAPTPQPVAPPPPPPQPPVAPPQPPPPPPPSKEPTPAVPAPEPEPAPQQMTMQLQTGVMKEPEPEYFVSSTDAEFHIEI